ncbi:MAG: alkaline phosphatase D family protein [Pseudomonadota bacterium]|nr:alkaline phosphatase D family protein [Pseudomonadota bacterium]
MLKFYIYFLIFFFFNASYSEDIVNKKTIKFIFGSCSNQNKLMPHWNYINSYKPDYLILLGDNVYGDFNNSDATNLQNAYKVLDNDKYFRLLKETTDIFSIWDDHDYGKNDGGKNWIYKEKAKKLFLDFYNVNENDERRKREGLYKSWEIYNSVKIKVIALDTRYFKDEFTINRNINIKKKYVSDYNNKKTILGKKQWNWVSNEFNTDYDILLILSSIQILSKNHGWEKWNNFPHERNKIINLIKNSKRPTIILSGDRHVGGIYKLNDKIYEITSSSFNQSEFNLIENDQLLIGKIITKNNFGFMKINTKEKVVDIQLREGFFNENKILSKIQIEF